MKKGKIFSIIGAGVLIAGTILAVVSFNQVMEATNTNEFCSNCHAQNVVPEYERSIHFANHAGVQATCADCHVPHEFAPKMLRKLEAAKEVYAHFMGKVDTMEKFEAERLHMAKREWQRMKETDSATCRSCHAWRDMDFTQQKTVAQKMHQMAISENKTCIDCHKGIAHELPAMKDVPSGFVQ